MIGEYFVNGLVLVPVIVILCITAYAIGWNANQLWNKLKQEGKNAKVFRY